jgi:pimeloyl-ACP methyl ester carboxylesterase
MGIVPDVRTIVVDGLRIRVIEERPRAERDDPVLMLHGLAGWAENWDRVMPQVVETGRRAIAIDLPGFGESDRPRRSGYFDPERPFYAPFVAAVLDALEVRRAHLVGHSLGGAVAYTAAVWRPERTRSLTLIAPGGLGATLAREFRLLTLPGMEWLARLGRTERATRQILHSTFYDPRNCDDDVLRQALRYGPPSVGEMVRALRSSVSFRTGVRDDIRRAWAARAERYTGPVLVVWGRQDAVLPVGHSDDARSLWPRADLALIDECGHFVMAERPRELLNVMLPFLDGAAA